MSGRIALGWSMAKASWAVLERYPRLLILPAISAAALLAALAVLLAAVTIKAGSFQQAGVLVKSLEQYFTDNWIVAVAGVGAIAFVLTSVSVFFNAELVFCTLRCYAGQTPSIRAGLVAALNRLPQILGWALVATVVGGLLSLVQEQLRDRLGFLGSMIGGLFDIAWAAVTYFVLPLLVVESVGPITAVKRSSAILRKTWGEAVVGNTGLSAIGLLLSLPAVAMMVAGIAIAIATGIGAIAMILFAAAILYFVVVSAIIGTLGTIFQTGLYIYATTGQAPIDEGLLKGAFQPKPARQAKSLTGWFRR